MEGALNQAFDEISFEMGFNGEKHDLILTPEGDKVKLFELIYFQKHAPKEVLEHWNILVGRQPVQNIGLRTNDGWEISGDDVQIWLEEQGENSFAISAYCEKLLPKLQEEEGRVWWMLTTLTDQVLGEIPHMRYIDSFDVLEEPKAEPSILLSQLPDHLKERGLELSTDPEAYLESYLGYEMKPNEDPDADWRLDVMVGSTNCVPLINGYLNADNDFMDQLHADGTVAGFFCYPLDTLREEEGSQKIFDFRDKLEEVFATDEGSEVLTLTGGATGLYCGYVDFIAWDIQTALNKAKEFFEGTDIPWASFHTFRREAGTVNLKTPPEEEPDAKEQENELEETLTGMDYIPVSYTHLDVYKRQLQGQKMMPPPWLAHREIERYSIGWRMGYGEDYIDRFGDWLGTLSPKERAEYRVLFPEPVTWKGWWDDEDSGEVLEHGDFWVDAWQPEGQPKYTRQWLQQEFAAGRTRELCLFWGHQPAQDSIITKSCLSQWWIEDFYSIANSYLCMEQYMMASKAQLFGDEEIRKEILKCNDPKPVSYTHLDVYKRQRIWSIKALYGMQHLLE